MYKDNKVIYSELIDLLSSTIPSNKTFKSACLSAIDKQATLSLCSIIEKNINPNLPLDSQKKISIISSAFECYLDSFSGDKAIKRNAFQEWLNNISSKLSQPNCNLLPRNTRGTIKWENLAHTPTTTANLVDITGQSRTTIKNNFLTLSGLQNLGNSKLYYTPERIQVFDELKFNSSEVGELFSCLSQAYTSSSQYNNKHLIKKIALDFYVQLTEYQKSIILPKFYQRKNNLSQFVKLLEESSSNHNLRFVTEKEEYELAKEQFDKESILLMAVKQRNTDARIDLIVKLNDEFLSINNCEIRISDESTEETPLYLVNYLSDAKGSIEITLSNKQIEDVIIIFNAKKW
ncbi:MAG: hypothetical protein IJ320_00545 [Phascolarctobacterium sp.]|nr:hypothetical protein [Phascolarctobacterium sp.]